MIMGGEVYLGDATTDQSWTIGRQLGLQIAAHILSPFGIRPIFDALAAGTGGERPHRDRTRQPLHPHDRAWPTRPGRRSRTSARRSPSPCPIEMNMRHGMPPIIKMQSLGMEPSLSVDVECTMTADFFTQMRVVHEHAAHDREPDGSRAGRFLSAQPVADAGRRHAAAADDARRAALRHDERREGACGSTARSAR